MASILLNNSEITSPKKTNFQEFSLPKKLSIETSVNWNIFYKNYGDLNKDDFIKSIIQVKDNYYFVNKTIENNEDDSLKKLCIKTLSLPEYQMC